VLLVVLALVGSIAIGLLPKRAPRAR